MDLNRCQTKISRVYRRYIARKKKVQGFYLVRISIECKRPCSPYYIAGDFTSPEWSSRLPLFYSLRHGEYFRELWLRPGSLFKIHHRGQSFVHPSFPLATDPEEGEVSTFALEFSPLDELRSLLGMHIKQKPRKNFRFVGQIASVPETGKDEDASFISPWSFAIADGVGSWRSQGVNSGDFARKLVCNIEDLLGETANYSTDSSSSNEKQTRPHFSLKAVVAQSLAEVKVPGSSTLLMVCLAGSKLRIYNIGDCSLMVVRQENGQPNIVFRTNVQQHTFNTPYQLAGDNTQDSVDEGELFEIQVTDGDLVIAGSDGLWDNLFDNEILDHVKGQFTRDAAKRLAITAQAKSCSELPTPFQRQSEREQSNDPWVGGKRDDITVVAALVRHN